MNSFSDLLTDVSVGYSGMMLKKQLGISGVLERGSDWGLKLGFWESGVLY